jgi:hypothetical protein
MAIEITPFTKSLFHPDLANGQQGDPVFYIAFDHYAA